MATSWCAFLQFCQLDGDCCWSVINSSPYLVCYFFFSCLISLPCDTGCTVIVVVKQNPVLFLQFHYLKSVCVTSLCCLYRSHRPASLWLWELEFGNQSGHLLVVMNYSWAWFYSSQLPSWLGSHLFQNSKQECSSTKHSAEVYRFLVFLVDRERTTPPTTKTKSIPFSRILQIFPVQLLLIPQII